MKKIYFIIFTLFYVQANAQLWPNYGGERAGLSALSFLKNDLNPRSKAMGGANVATDGNVYSTLTNPAGLSDVNGNSYALSHLFLNAGVNQSMAIGAFRLKDKVSHLGVSINSLNSGAMEERTEFQPLGTGREIYLSNLAMGVTYTRKFSTLFSAGITLKYVYEGIAEFSNHTATVDVGFLYNTDFKDLKFAAMIQNFGGNSSLSNDDQILPVLFNRDANVALDPNTVPSIFKLGASIKPLKTEKHSLMLSAELQHPNDNAENYRLGAEYQIMDLFFVRAGYQINVKDQNYPTAGFGYRINLSGVPLYIDYAMAPTNFMGIQNCIGLRIDFLNESRD